MSNEALEAIWQAIRKFPRGHVSTYGSVARAAGLPELRLGVLACPAAVVHGWKDDVVPYEHSIRFAKEYGASLHLLESDHRLHNQLRVVRQLFEYFLIALDLPATAFD
jgi:fermentation-respiration switch protein FrsA (DUF1100 family)